LSKFVSMTTYTIKRGRKSSGFVRGLVILPPSIRKTVRFTSSCVHDVIHSTPGNLFGVVSPKGRSVKFMWEYDPQFDRIWLYAAKSMNGEEERFSLGMVPVGEDLRMDILMSDTYVVFAVAAAGLPSMSKFVPFERVSFGLEVRPSFPVKAPHDIKIEMK